MPPRSPVMRNKLLVRALVCLSLPAFALQAANPELLQKVWSARWISVAGASPFDYGVYHFRRSFDLPAPPASFLIHVTADNRYKLYVNGEFVSLGPARGDLHHWRYDSLDIASHLRTGRNVLAAVVWNFGEKAPEAQTTNQTGFLRAGRYRRRAHRRYRQGMEMRSRRRLLPCPRRARNVSLLFRRRPRRSVGCPPPSVGLGAACLRRFRLVRALRLQRRLAARCAGWSQSLDAGAAQYPARRAERLSPSPFSVAGPTARQFPPTRKPSSCSIRHFSPPAIPNSPSAEAKTPASKSATPNRSFSPASAIKAIATKSKASNSSALATSSSPMAALTADSKPFGGEPGVICASPSKPPISPFRSTIFTASTPAILSTRKARFDAGSPEIQKILDTGWRTARLCAHETYMDCPYYEQLQYVGDTRVQSLVSLYMTGDGRLMRNAIESHRFLAQRRRRNLQPRALPPPAIHPAVLPLVDRHAARLLDVSGRSGFRRSHAPRRPRRALVLRRPPAGRWIPRQPALVELRRLDQGMGRRRPAQVQGTNSAPLDLQLLLAYQ